MIEEIALWIVIWVICGFIAGKISSSKGRTFIEGFLLGVLIGFLGIIAELVLSRKSPSRKCPYCAEVVKIEATVCKHCGRDLPIYLPEKNDNLKESGITSKSAEIKIVTAILSTGIGTLATAMIALPFLPLTEKLFLTPISLLIVQTLIAIWLFPVLLIAVLFEYFSKKTLGLFLMISISAINALLLFLVSGAEADFDYTFNDYFFVGRLILQSFISFGCYWIINKYAAYLLEIIMKKKNQNKSKAENAA